MWPDLPPTWYLTVQNLHDNPEMNYERMREEFNRMTDLCKGLTSDIGYSDMLLQFDDEGLLMRAINILNDNKMMWKRRDE